MTSPSPPPHQPPPDAPPPVQPTPAVPFASTPPQAVLDGRYKLDGRIATGGMGEVWRGLDLTLGRPVAVKLLRPEYASDESFLVRFRGEARHAARLSHPGVASVYDYGEVATADDHPTAYLVMELVEGEPLSAVLHREKRLSPERMLDVLGQAADALQAAHTLNVVHRDVKPGNLLIRRDGVVKVTDFGIARAVDAAPLTATGIMMGTAYYVSPEQASGRPVTPASDVYSLGVVAYECLTGRRPFDDRNPIVVVMAHQQDTPPPLPSDIPYNVRALVDSAMAKDPHRRPASAGAFARTAAGIRRSLWNAEAAGRWQAGPPALDATAAYAGPSNPPEAYPRGDRPPPAWNDRQPSWLTGPDGAGAGAGAGASGPAAPSDHAGQSAYGGQSGYAAGQSAYGGQGGYGDDATAYAERPGRLSSAGHTDTPPQLPEWERGRSHRRSGSGSGAATQRQLPIAVLVVLLLLTVLVTALVTRQLAAGDDTSDSGAPPPRGVVDTVRGEGGIVSGSIGHFVPSGWSSTDTGPVTAGLVRGGIERSTSVVRLAATGSDPTAGRALWRVDVG